MSGKRKLLYWETCVFLAWIKNETCWPDDVTKGIEQTIEEWRANRLVIGTSAITMIEVLSSEMTKEQKDAFSKVFSDPRLQLIDVDRRIAGKASAIHSHYDTREFKPDGSHTGSCMGMGDAIHLATAIHFDAYEFQTLDGAGKRKRRTDLLKLDGNVAGARLPIKLPKYIPPPEPLSGPLSTVVGSQPSFFDGVIPDEEEQEVEPVTPNVLGSGDDHPQGQTGSKPSETGANEAPEPEGDNQAEAVADPPPPTEAPATEAAGAEDGSKLLVDAKGVEPSSAESQGAAPEEPEDNPPLSR